MQKAHKKRESRAAIFQIGASQESVSLMLAAPLAVRDNHDFLEEVEMRFGHKHGPIKPVTQTLTQSMEKTH